MKTTKTNRRQAGPVKSHLFDVVTVRQNKMLRILEEGMSKERAINFAKGYNSLNEHSDIIAVAVPHPAQPVSSAIRRVKLKVFSE